MRCSSSKSHLLLNILRPRLARVACAVCTAVHQLLVVPEFEEVTSAASSLFLYPRSACPGMTSYDADECRADNRATAADQKIRRTATRQPSPSR